LIALGIEGINKGSWHYGIMAFHFHTHEDSIFADTIAVTLSVTRQYCRVTDILPLLASAKMESITTF